MRIALVGYDVEGQASYRYFASQADEIVIFDEAELPRANPPKGVEVISGPQALERLKGMSFDKVVRTPSLAPSKLSGVANVTTATKEFFRCCPAPIVGVTGTKGKGTTCSLVAKLLEAVGKKVWLVGNIGKPALDVLKDIKPEDIVVYELSSFQLWDLDKSPSVAVVLMIEPDHLNIHENFEDYVRAKSNITLHQQPEDIVIYHPDNSYSQAIADASPAINKKKYLTSQGARIDNSRVVIDEQKICSINEIGLLGQHNLENICAAVTAAWEFSRDAAAIAETIKNFKGLEHRLEFVREIKEVDFYNDSFSSAPSASLAAMRSFIRPEVVILGGYDKESSFDDLANEIKLLPNIKKLLLIGETRNKIAQALEAAGAASYEMLETANFEEIIKRAFSVAEPGDVVLLSPGCASFDMFKNFYERGAQFKKIVGEIHV